MTAVLYDVPGPRARRRNLLLGVGGVVLLLAVAGFVVYRFAVTGQFDPDVWQWILYKNIQLLLVDALFNTLRAFAVAAVLALVFGAVFAAGRLSDHRWLSGPSTAVVEFFRAVPLLILIFIMYFGVSRGLGINVSAFTALVLGLMLYNGSVLAEIFRAGVASLPRGQSEAAYALGMRKTQVMTNVLLPQALRAMLPTIISQLVVVLKDTALGFIILYPELLYQARFLGSQVQLGSPILPVAMVVAAIYITMCLLLAQFAHYVERRTRRIHPGDPAAPVDDTAVEMEQVRAGTP
ncbi:MAG TPA: amino acid ABC transporter permease [Pseudonocardia sp.]|nr:amino acid ABC transporter permease [Pseudonocardia sp.]